MDTLVLSSGYQPLRQTTWQDAISMWFAGRVEIVSVYQDKFIRTVDKTFNVPSIVRFIGKVVKNWAFERKARFSKKNVFYRDKGECQYCKKKLKLDNFTIDHVIPASQGGLKRWDNIVACCKACNQVKGNRTPKQAKMHLRSTPKIPRYSDIKTVEKNMSIPKEWLDYL